MTTLVRMQTVVKLNGLSEWSYLHVKVLVFVHILEKCLKISHFCQRQELWG